MGSGGHLEYTWRGEGYEIILKYNIVVNTSSIPTVCNLIIVINVHVIL